MDPTGAKAGVTRQLDDCLALVDRLDLEVVARYEDNDVSAYTGRRRPDFELMLSAMGRGEFDTLVVWHPDRLTRSVKDLERVIDAADARGVCIRSVTGGDVDLSNATGKMLARIVGSVARQESEHKAERQRTANMKRAAEGDWSSTRRCFGYALDGQVLEAEAQWIRQAAADVLDGKSLRQIAREWNAAGVSSVRGAEWNTSRVKRILTNPRYAGVRTYRGTVAAAGKWEAIIDADTHAGLLAVLRDASRGGAVSYERKYLGSYRYRCGRCGAPLHHTVNTQRDGKSFSRYACTKAAHLSRSQPELDAYVERVVLAFLRGNPKLHERLAQDRGHADVPTLRGQRAALAAQKDELATLLVERVLDVPGVRRESAKLQGKIAGIDAELAELARTNPVVKLLEEGLEELESRWAVLSPDLKGKLVDEICMVTVMPSPKGRYFREDCIRIEPK